MSIFGWLTCAAALNLGCTLQAYELVREYTPPPFEKFYVSPEEILSTPYGCYYKCPDGQLERVQTINRDGGGTYVIRIERLCPICGRYCSEKTPPEGYACQLWEKD